MDIDIDKQLMIKQSPGFLKVEVEDFRKKLDAYLADYRIVVTAETVSDAKKAMADLNKAKKAIADKRKAVVDKFGEPVKKFIEDMKELEIDVEKARSEIKSQADRFDDEAKAAIREGLISHRDFVYDEMHIAEEFQTATIDDLVKLTALTPSGNDLTKATKDAIESRVRDCRALQDRTAARLMELENISYKNGLKSPLTREYVEPFLFKDDAEYQSRLTRLMDVELNRQRQIEEQATTRAVETVTKVTEAQQAAQPKETPPPQEPEPEPEQPRPQEDKPQPEPIRRQPTHGNNIWDITCVFRLEAPPGVDEPALDHAVRELLTKAGMIKKLSSVYIKQEESAA